MHTPIHPNRHACCQQSEVGMSLLEVTITIAVFSSLALSVALMIVPIARQSRINRETNIANASAKKILEEINATPFNDITTRYPHGSENAIADLPEGRLIVSYQDVMSDPLIITLDLEWESPDLGHTTRTFHTARTE